jgi:hypothetical protein
MYNGELASKVIRVVGIALVIVGPLAALGMMDDDPTSIAISGLILLNSLVGGALLIVFGAICENLIGIRHTLASRLQGVSPDPSTIVTLQQESINAGLAKYR